MLTLALLVTGCGAGDTPTARPTPPETRVTQTPEKEPEGASGQSNGNADDRPRRAPRGDHPNAPDRSDAPDPVEANDPGRPDQVDAAGRKRADAFVDAALAQRGDPYVFGVEVRLGDPDPGAFDSSELTQWAADQAGASIPDGAMYQYLELKSQGRLVSVEEGIHTRGALLFHFTSEPTAGGGRPSSSHVAISLGDGRTIEARGSSYGVDEFPAVGRFNFAGVIAALDRAAPATRSAPTTRAGSSTMRSLRLGISEIYGAARAAGFTPRQATTWTAIALAESGGETGAIDTAGEQAVGLWRIGVAPGSRTSRWGDLSDPLVNARAAYEISCRGADMRPWSSTHAINAGTSRDYRVFLDDVEAVTGHAGDRRGAENPREKGR